MRYDIRLELIYERHMQAEQKEKQQQQHELRKYKLEKREWSKNADMLRMIYSYFGIVPPASSISVKSSKLGVLHTSADGSLRIYS